MQVHLVIFYLIYENKMENFKDDILEKFVQNNEFLSKEMLSVCSHEQCLEVILKFDCVNFIAGVCGKLLMVEYGFVHYIRIILYVISKEIHIMAELLKRAIV